MRHPRQRRPPRHFAFWLLPLAALALLLQMPAHRLGSLIESACAGQCRLAELSGPWWAGQGLLFVRTPGSEGWLSLGTASWQPLPGGTDLLAIELAGGRIVIDAQLTARIDHLQLPASLALGHPAWQLPATGWQGTLELTQTVIGRAGRRPGESHGRLIWRDAASGLLENHPLGDLQASWRWLPDNGLSAELDGGRAGEIAVNGHLQAGELSVEISLDGESRQVLERYLQSFAVPQADHPGRYLLTSTVR